MNLFPTWGILSPLRLPCRTSCYFVLHARYTVLAGPKHTDSTVLTFLVFKKIKNYDFSQSGDCNVRYTLVIWILSALFTVLNPSLETSSIAHPGVFLVYSFILVLSMLHTWMHASHPLLLCVSVLSKFYSLQTRIHYQYHYCILFNRTCCRIMTRDCASATAITWISSGVWLSERLRKRALFGFFSRIFLLCMFMSIPYDLALHAVRKLCWPFLSGVVLLEVMDSAVWVRSD